MKCRRCLNLCLALLVLLAGCISRKPAAASSAAASADSTPAAAYQNTEIRAMWFSYIDYRDLFQNLDEVAFREKITAAVASMKDLGINTIYVHASAFTDALYDSAIYPRSQDLPGIDYDPLAIFTTAAHSQGMRIEAWVNPLRSLTLAEAANLDSSFLIKQWIDRNDERVRPVSGRYYLNPAYPEVRDLVVQVVQEILDHYDVDGIQFDDYFYPTGAGNNFDAYIYGKATETENISREDFRRQSVNQLVQAVHDAVAAKGGGRVFGISPAGNLELDTDTLFADPAAWIAAGSVDYLAPQIYWGFLNPVKPFEATLQQWQQLTAGSGVDLIAGLAGYKVGLNDGYAGSAATEWIDHTDMLARQAAMSRTYSCKGFAIFRYGSLFAPDAAAAEAAGQEITALKQQISQN